MQNRFPDDFTFGVATSAYQVEGGIENDWSQWERMGKLKEPDARCGRAVEHWERFESDLGLVQELGASAYRLSLEWARLEPRPGEFDAAAVAGYRQRLEAMRARGIRPIVTLHHFTNPLWLQDRCGWHTPQVLPAWRRYAKLCAELLDGLGAAVITFNEPMVFVLGGYLQGVMPPGVKDAKQAAAAIENVARAHVIAREELLLRSKALTCGISQHLMVFAPARRWNPFDQALTRIAEENFNHGLLRALTTGELSMRMPAVISLKARIDGARDSMEFLGINYYTRSHLKFVPRPPFAEFGFRDVHGRGLTDIGWEDYPEGFLQVLKDTKRYRLPVWVTENGIDDRTGQRRPGFIHRHLQALLAARAEGVDVRAYLHWSLLDNFEWLEAWGPRFGLYRVNLETMERQKTPAVDYFRQVATSRELTAP
ncbi:MAG: glycoside hydrolase family 1 protein [Archangiaceae bacterium]|nr:glycoside hydrolase family 1 protein [Archangiaceae bacterium]